MIVLFLQIIRDNWFRGFVVGVNLTDQGKASSRERKKL